LGEGNRVRTVLLVDDDDLARGSTPEMLGELGYVVVEAASGDEALRLAKAGLVFDLLVTDHLMPGRIGENLARLVAEIRPATIVLLVAGYAEIDGLAADMNQLAKPFRQAVLAATSPDNREPRLRRGDGRIEGVCVGDAAL